MEPIPQLPSPSSGSGSWIDWNVIILVFILLLAIGYAVYAYRVDTSGSNTLTTSKVPVNVLVTASIVRLLLTSLGFMAALAFNNAIQASVTDLTRDIPGFATAGPWMYATFVVAIVVISSFGMTLYLNRVTNTYGKEAMSIIDLDTAGI